MKCPTPLLARARSASGFTLVELLVVMAIISLVATLAIIGFKGVNSALSLSGATQAISAELTNARQTALTLDETVQVRFYQYPDSTGATTTKEFQAMQTFSSKDNVTFTPLDKMTYLPPNIMISANTTYSPPLSPTDVTPITPASSDPPINQDGVGHNYTYVPISFKSNGTMDTTNAAITGSWYTGTWFITVYEKKYATVTQLVNYTTISIDPQDGRMRIFQP